jgi:RimJ/RimL family protein N-acetyltransferase
MDVANLQLKRFQAEHYAEYFAWFADEELNRHLGPMAETDEPWLAAVLAETSSEAATWAVFRGDVMVAVVEAVYDPENAVWAAITAIATRPDLRTQGIGETVLRRILALHQQRGITEHVAYVKLDNEAARRCIEKVGFAAATGEPNEQGYVAFRHRQ